MRGDAGIFQQRERMDQVESFHQGTRVDRDFAATGKALRALHALGDQHEAEAFRIEPLRAVLADQRCSDASPKCRPVGGFGEEHAGLLILPQLRVRQAEIKPAIAALGGLIFGPVIG